MWSTVTPSLGSPVPCTRSKLAICMHDNYIYLLGGRSRNQQIKDFWRYDISEHTWLQLKSSGDGPPRLEDHSMVAWKDQLYVFGGEVGFASTGETPLWIYDTICNLWRKKWKYNSIVQPQGCRGHTAVVFHGSMYIYGGYRDLKGSSNELWNFDFDNETWRLITPTSSNEMPPGRHDHSAVVHDSAMWVYGGMTNLQERTDFWRWDFEIRFWSRVKCKGGPGELHGHTACKVFSSMLVFGGEKSRQPIDALWRFHFATETWEKLSINGVLPGPRSRHCALVVPSVALIPAAQRPKSIPCRSALNRSNDIRQRPISSPPVTSRLDNEKNGHGDASYYSRDTSSFYKNAFGPRHSESHNQLNFRALKEKISNVSLLKPSYSTYSALSNSSDSVQEDEPDQFAEMQYDAKGKLRSVSQSASLFSSFQPGVHYRRRAGETISRDMMSVPNFQQLTAVVPAREAKTPQSGPSTGRYSLNEPLNDWPGVMYGNSHDGPGFEHFLQYYSLVPGGICQNGFDNITDSEDSGIHGLKSTESTDKNNCYWNKGLTGDENNGILPGMVEDTNTTTNKSYDRATSTAKRSVSAYEDFSLIDLNNDNVEKSFLDGIKQDLKNGSVTMVVNHNYNHNGPSTSGRESHKDFASCLNYSDTVLKEKRLSSANGVELTTFPKSPDSGPTGRNGHTEDNTRLTLNLQPAANNVVFRNSYKSSQTKVKSIREVIKQEESTNDFEDNHPLHFSMLVFGGREEGQQSCLSKPLVTWRCEVWR